jgi:hypothetical protein
MSYLLNSAAQVPLEIRIRIIDEYYPGALEGKAEHLTQMFSLYLQYLAPQKHGLKINCSSCLSTVMSHWKTVINHWKL